MILIQHKIVLPILNQVKKMYEEIFEEKPENSLSRAPEEIYKRESAKLYIKNGCLQCITKSQGTIVWDVQLDHECVMIKVEDMVKLLYKLLFLKVEENEAHKQCVEK